MRNIYKEINKMENLSKIMKSIAIDEFISYKDSEKIRNRQREINNKCLFYKGFLRAINKKRSA